MSGHTGSIRNSAKAIIVRNGCLLVQSNVDAQGPWYLLPGGGQQHGETLIEALRRECLEEIAAEVRVGRMRCIREYLSDRHEFAATDPGQHQVEFMFECELVDADYVPTVGHEPDGPQVGVEWLPLERLRDVRLYPGALRALLVDGFGDGRFHYLGDAN